MPGSSNASALAQDGRRVRTQLLVLVALSVVLRAAAGFYMGDAVEALPGTADQLSYHELALRVLGGHGFSFGEPWWPATQAEAPTAHWSYAYTYFLVAVYGVFGLHPLAARLVQAVVVGVLQPLLAYRLGRVLFGHRIGLIVSALTAGYAYFVYYAGALMTESFYIVCILGALDLAILLAAEPDEARPPRAPRIWAEIGLGLTLGLAVLLRQVVLLAVPVIVLWLWIAGRTNWRSRLRSIAVAGTVIGACVVPFTIYNSTRFPSFVLLNTNAGFALYWGNHPIHGTSFQSILSPEQASYGELLPAEIVGLDEASLDRELLARGVRFVLDDPARYVLLSVSRIADYFQFWPTAESGRISNIARVLSFGWLWPFMAAGLGWELRRLRTIRGIVFSPAGLLSAFAGFYALIHLLSWALIRYRLPVDAVLLVFAGIGVSVVLEKARLRWRSASARFIRTAHVGPTEE
jgi:4-amino-4-deoxy-L-arabinose transferase-like glycosyltransferase